jgi:hypothetical protein
VRVEQALFTSIRGARLDGYQLAAKSDGISTDTEQLLTAWGPAHDSLLDTGPSATSINFHPAGDDLFALSHTRRSGQEYSGRSGGRIVTHYFVFDTETFTRFARNPLKILQALRAAGRVRLSDPLPTRLTSFPLAGRASDDGAGESALQFAAAALDQIAAAVRDERATAIVSPEPAERWLGPVIARLSHDDRLKLSFTTGLRPTACRPFLLCTLPDEPALIRQTQRSGTSVVSFQLSVSR